MMNRTLFLSVRQGFKPLAAFRFKVKSIGSHIKSGSIGINITESQDTALPISVNLTLNPVRDCCLTIKLRSPLAPLKKGTGIFSKSPFLRGI
jgi:hypothetical protein